MAHRASLSTNIPASGGRKVRRAIQEATRDAATEHAKRHLPWHFEPFAVPKYGYDERSWKYKKLRRKMVQAGLLSADDEKRPLVLKKELINSVLKNWRVTATGTEGSTLILKAPLTSGRTLDVAAIKRMLNDTKRSEQDAPRLRRLLAKLIRSKGELSKNQKAAIRRVAELKALAKDELKHLIGIEEETFGYWITYPDLLRKLT